MYGLDRCAVLVLKQKVKVRCKGIVLPNGQMMGEVDKGINGYKYLDVLQGAYIMQKEWNRRSEMNV